MVERIPKTITFSFKKEAGQTAQEALLNNLRVFSYVTSAGRLYPESEKEDDIRKCYLNTKGNLTNLLKYLRTSDGVESVEVQPNRYAAENK